MRLSTETGRPSQYLGALALFLTGFALAACGGAGSITGPAAVRCAGGPYFTVLPVSPADFDEIAVFGGLGAPGHTLPTAHTGFGLTTEGAAVRAPGPIQIHTVRRTRYIASPNRQGAEDYAVEFQVCKEISGWFGHLTSLSPTVPVPANKWKDCDTYSTATETVESCYTDLDNVHLVAGDPLGTSGLSIALGLMGLDFGMLDSRVNNFYASRWRHPDPSFEAICPWEQFEPGIKTQLYSRLKDGSRPGLVPAGEPRCGTMAVDVAGTAQGVWALPSETQPAAGNETNYITLANYPYRPQDNLALSVGPAALGAMVGMVPRQTTGRINRAFYQVTNDGLIYCYGPEDRETTKSWLLSLTGPTTLSIRMVTHAAGASPCLANPSTWSMTAAVQMVR